MRVRYKHMVMGSKGESQYPCCLTWTGDLDIQSDGLPQINLLSELQGCIDRWLSSSVDLLETAAHLKQAGDLPSQLELWATENPNVNPPSRLLTKASHPSMIALPIQQPYSAFELLWQPDSQTTWQGQACFTYNNGPAENQSEPCLGMP